MKRLGLTLLLLAGCSLAERRQGPENDPYTRVQVGEVVPEFEVTSTDGAKTFRSSQRVTGALLYLLWSECPTCRQQTPITLSLAEFLAENDVELVCIARGGEENATQAMAEEYWASAGNGEGTEAGLPPLYYDEGRRVFDLFASQGVPRLYLVGRDGRIRWQAVGLAPADNIIQAVCREP
ncbi:MAG: TlpA family protein disulfide reductase [Rikenellaceae bacterium]|jgi:thiol-disulfide isomerase/thioredoxin|nr:TlpA family protein disulfide reductase [Rikenellaceae bacterium]